MGEARSAPDKRRIYRRDVQRRVLSVSFAFFVLVDLASLLSGPGDAGSRTFFIVFGVAAALLAYRAIRAATIVAGPDYVVVRTLVRDYRFPWATIRSFSAATGNVSIFRRTYLTMCDTSGRWRSFKEFNSPRPRFDGTTAVVDVVNELNGLVQERQKEVYPEGSGR